MKQSSTMKRKAEVECIDSLTEMMKESNMFDEGDEYKLLVEGYTYRWDARDQTCCLIILNKAKYRYQRYLRNINFGFQYDYIEERINLFLSEFEVSKEGVELMKEIDGLILEVIEHEEEPEELVKRRKTQSITEDMETDN